MQDPRSEMASLAAQQWGVLHQRQLRTIGTRAAREHELRASRWTDLGAGVFAAAAAPSGRNRDLMAAVLGAGPQAVVSHGTAAAMWGFPGADGAIEVTRLRGTNSTKRGGVVVHEPRLVLADHLVALDKIPVVSPTLACYQLAARLRDERLERLVDWFWSRGLVHWAGLSNALARLAKRGRPGITAMRAVLDARGPDHVPPASGLEHRMQSLLKEWGLGDWRRQVDVGSTGWIGRVDFVHPELPLVIEVQSDVHHRARSHRADDGVRFEDLQRAGFFVVEAWEREIWHSPQLLRRRLGNVMRSARLVSARRSA